MESRGWACLWLVCRRGEALTMVRSRWQNEGTPAIGSVYRFWMEHSGTEISRAHLLHSSWRGSAIQWSHWHNGRYHHEGHERMTRLIWSPGWAAVRRPQWVARQSPSSLKSSVRNAYGHSPALQMADLEIQLDFVHESSLTSQDWHLTQSSAFQPAKL